MLRVSLCRGHALRQPSERSVWRLRTSGTHYRMTFVTPIRCQPTVLNWKHTFFTVAYSWCIPTSVPLYWIGIIGTIQIFFYITLHYTANSHCWFKPDTRHAGPITLDLTERFSAIWAKAVMPFTQICSPTASQFGDLFVIKHYLRNWRHIICIRLLQIRCNCASSEWDILRLCPSDNVCMLSNSYFTAPSCKCNNRPGVWTPYEFLLVSSLSHSFAVHSCSEPGEPESNLKILKMIKWEIQISRYILVALWV